MIIITELHVYVGKNLLNIHATFTYVYIYDAYSWN